MLLLIRLPLAGAEPVRLAVAANFAAPAVALSRLYHNLGNSDEAPEVVIGSSGQLAAQLIKGAPWDIFFSADMARITRMQAYGLVNAGEARVYARGRLVFWQPQAVTDTVLKTRLQSVKPVAMANERLAPYGKAAFDVLNKLGLSQPGLALVRGQSVSQAHAMVRSGAAPAGFVALSQMDGVCNAPTCLMVPAEWHDPIEQGVAVMAKSRNHQDSLNFYRFLMTDRAITLIRQFGYLDGDAP